MSYRSEFQFHPRKKAAGVYFNTGMGMRYSIQVDRGHEKNPSPLLLDAINAAMKEFFRVYYGKETR